MRTSSYPPLRWAYAAGYGAILLPVVARLRLTAEIRSVQIKLPGGPFCFGSSDIDLWGVVAPVSLPAFLALCDRLSNLLEPQHALGRIIDLYLLSEAEAELRGRIESQSSMSHRIRLTGAGQRLCRTEAGPEQSRLGRVMYRFMNMSRMVMRAPLDAHQARILSKSLLNIDQEWRRQPSGFAGSPQYGAVIATAYDSARGKLINPEGDAQAPGVLAAALEAADAISVEFSAPSDKSGEFVPAEYAAAPMGLELAIAKVRRPIDRLCADIGEMLSAVMLGGNPGFDYVWRTYFIVREGLSPADRMKVFSWLASAKVRDFFQRFSLGYPIVLTSSMWRSMHRWYHPDRPVEEFYFFKRHGISLWGEDLRDQLSAPGREDVLRSAAISIAHIRSQLWRAVHAGQARHLSNLLLGRLPTLWLLLTRGVVATSSGEAMETVHAESLPHVEALASLHATLRSLSPRELPSTSESVWTPVLEKATEWIDAALESALRQVH